MRPRISKTLTAYPQPSLYAEASRSAWGKVKSSSGILSLILKIQDFTIEGLPSIRYYMTAQDRLLFDSSGEYDESGVCFFDGDSEGVIEFQGQRLYSKSRLSGNNTTVISYTIARNEMIIAMLKDTPFIFSITVLFTSFSIIIHFFMNGVVKREISVIQDGLSVIADNNLDYRLPTDFKQNGLPEIAQNINEISSKLNENIKKHITLS